MAKFLVRVSDSDGLSLAAPIVFAESAKEAEAMVLQDFIRFYPTMRGYSVSAVPAPVFGRVDADEVRTLPLGERVYFYNWR